MKDTSPRLKLLNVLAARTAVFFLAACALSFFLYGLGTAQEFTDWTQLTLLRIAGFLGVLLAVAAIYGLFLDIITRGKFFVLGIFLYVFLTGIGAGAAAAAWFIIIAAGGNG